MGLILQYNSAMKTTKYTANIMTLPVLDCWENFTRVHKVCRSQFKKQYFNKYSLLLRLLIFLPKPLISLNWSV